MKLPLAPLAMGPTDDEAAAFFSSLSLSSRKGPFHSPVTGKDFLTVPLSQRIKLYEVSETMATNIKDERFLGKVE